jgi:hypothetical protein
LTAETLKNIFGFMGGNELPAVLFVNKKFFFKRGQKYFMAKETQDELKRVNMSKKQVHDLRHLINNIDSLDKE